MSDDDHVRLLHGPYTAPPLRRGDRARCLFRSRVQRMSRRTKVPSYRLHKQSGQALVTLTDGLGNRRDVPLDVLPVSQRGSAEKMEESRLGRSL